MKEENLRKAAKLLINHSLGLKKEEKVLIAAYAGAKDLAITLVEEAYRVGAYPYVELNDNEVMKALIENATVEQISTMNDWHMQRYRDIDAVIAIEGEDNDAEFSDIPPEQLGSLMEALKPSNNYMTNNLRWVLFKHPTPANAQKAGKSTKGFESYLFDVTTNVDYQKMAEKMTPLVKLMEETDRVKIVSPGTNLSFSIKDIPAVPCAGHRNVPDGEIYTAPVRDSVNGKISYNTPCPYFGTTYKDVTLTFENGKIVEATSDQPDKIKQIFDTDEGALYIGEFAIGLNPKITKPMGDILFDEKIAGSIHFTPGKAYDNANNGNESQIHWDMVLIQTPEYGGGEIYFDDVLIRKDGRFVLPELEGLNPENLLND
ncbi:aminopeptidase [Virgibacillus siamensis]|uniref:aminopeptidase n=1 Tax=Virgibacillus siamensis TaxID=480071 RepID=UPI000987BA25|nr:aminopeptidase [Virgibacillus siamensis]